MSAEILNFQGAKPISGMGSLSKLYTEQYEPNDDVKGWVKKHKDSMKGQAFEDDLKMLRVFKTNYRKDAPDNFTEEKEVLKDAG